MANMNVPKTIDEAIDEFAMSKRCAESLAHILTDILDDSKFECALEINDPAHPVQLMYACITAIQYRLKDIETIIYSVPALDRGTTATQ